MSSSTGVRGGTEVLSPAPRAFSRGFTLIELMITLAIGAILLTLGTAAFTRIIAENRMATAVNDFVSTLKLARSEAIKRGIRVTVCVNTDNDNTTCENPADGWSAGYVVIADRGGTDEELLRIQAGKAAVQVEGQRSTFTYDTDGSTDATEATDELHFEDSSGRADCRVVTVSAVGYVSTAKEDDATCPDFPE